MRGGVARLATTPLMSSTLDESVVPAIVDLIADQEASRSYLLEATPYDPDAPGEVTVRASINLPHSILDDEYWPAILQSAVDSNVDLYGNAEDEQGRTSFGNIPITLGDGGHDELIGYYWDNRDITIKLGGPDFDYADYRTVVAGTAESITYTNQGLNLVLRGKEYLLEDAVQSTAYAGTGSTEGDENLEGVLKPLTYGQVWGITPVPVDPENLIYQFHDGSVHAVLNAWDGGLALTSQGNVADITTAIVGEGFYKTQLDEGFIRLGAPVAKQLTLDVQGDNSGEGYRTSAPDIIKRILIDKVGLSADDLNLASFLTARLDSQRTSVGVYITKETAVETVTALMQSVGGAWTFNRQGKFTVNVMHMHRPVDTLTEADIVAGTFLRDRTQPPSWKRRIGYQRIWTSLNEDQLSSSIPDARKMFMSTEYRYNASSDATVKTRHAAARTIERDTMIGNQTDALTAITRQQDIFSKRTERFDVTLRRAQFKYTVGETITLQYDRYSIDVDCIILGIRENTKAQQTTLRLLAVHV